ncbi:LOW QUALITY PROTEIN: large ribosomal subunit protein mL38 [Chanos chanos]|uniref:Large ribosomal subunit protein mL38 n=1 Tax=Chanos chanos TaxID=29144 RepID=A0A6J2VD08_CHACN|nr:LOW QUALITY PROTEIN: 39S ribosomal protein L38, mitochondrial [Chanos chanos]
MALRTVWRTVIRSGTELGSNNVRGIRTTAVLCHRAAPLGPMPNEDIDWKNLETLEKYRSYTRYLKTAEEANSNPVWWRTYGQYIEQEKGDNAHERVNIGLPHCRPSRTKEARDRKKQVKENRCNPELERAARLRNFRIPLERVRAEWEVTSGPYHIQRLAEHYGVYRDLFPMAYFVPRIMLRVTYGDDNSAAVHFGNHLTPSKAAALPQVSFTAEDDSLWTLLLTSPDEHLEDGEQEYVHWLVGNIPGSAVQSGEEVCNYFPPLPPKGTGFHRYIFILFKQEASVDFGADRRPSPCHSLRERTFSTLQFYRKHQEVLTPAGLAFFQCQWDESVTQTFHTLLHMKEPVFEYDRPPVYHPPQKKYPHRQPLRYLDRYRNGHKQTFGIY